MTIKRRHFFRFLGKTYAGRWKTLKPNYSENVYSNGVGYETVKLQPANESLILIPEGKESEMDIVAREAINNVGRPGKSDYRDLIWQLKDGIEDGKIEFLYEPTLPKQARK